MKLPRTPSFRLDGKRALVTGASRGIGLGCAVALAEMGAQVVMVARSSETLEATAATIRAEGMSAQAQALDVTNIEAVMAFFARISDPLVGGTYMTLLNTFSNHLTKVCSVIIFNFRVPDTLPVI